MEETVLNAIQEVRQSRRQWMRRVTYDTNIYISAFQFGGAMRPVLQMMMDGQIDVAVSEPIIQETLRVSREKFHWSDERLHQAETIMNAYAVKVSPAESLNVVPGDMDGNCIIECTIASGSEAIVAGDKDLLRIGSYQGTKMIRVSE